MTMIYDPGDITRQLAVKFSDALGGAAKNAAMYFAANWAMGENEPWTYYAGVASGSLAAATGVPGAAIVFYVVGDLVDMHILKSPSGSLIRVYLNGVASYSVSTYSAAATWELLQIALNDITTRVEIVSEPDPDHPVSMSASFGMGISFPWTVTSTRPETAPARVMGAGLSKSASVWAITYTFQDAKKKKARTKVYYPGAATFEEASAYALAIRDAYLGGLGLVMGAIVDISISQDARLPTGIKASPRSTADVEEQMRLCLETEANRSTTHSIPTFDGAYTTLTTNQRGDYERTLTTTPRTTQYVSLLIGGGGFPAVQNNRGEPLIRLKKSKGTWTT